MLFETIAQINSINLTSPEVVIEMQHELPIELPNELGSEEPNGLEVFIRSCSNLEQLYVLFKHEETNRSDLGSNLFFDNDLNCSPKRLIMHSVPYKCVHVSNGSLVEPVAYDLENAYELIWQPYVDRRVGVECLGICESPQRLKRLFENTYRCSGLRDLKLLHLRRSYSPSGSYIGAVNLAHYPDREWLKVRVPPSQSIGSCDTQEDLEDLAHMLFEEEDFEELRVLAIGDFSHERRYEATNRLYCVEDDADDDPGLKRYREFTPDDQHILDEIEGARELLKACPASSF